MSNPRFDGDYADYQEYVRIVLKTTGREGLYDEEIVQAAWDRQVDGIAAALDCVEAAQ